MLVKIYILLTLVHYLFFNKNKELLVVLVLGAANSIVSTVFKCYDISIAFNSYLYILFHTLVWLYVIKREMQSKKFATIGIVVFFIFSVYLLLIAESIIKVDSPLLFIVGALFYLIFFLFLSFKQLRNENLAFFTNNNFILLFSPILFFIGFSFVFAFKNRNLNETILWEDISLYNLISYFINIIYYSLINLYIYKERSKHE